jgi:TetR/AcrR family transcriptional regulator, regulator of cefoperazone and chloramphenicol sensitivity
LYLATVEHAYRERVLQVPFPEWQPGDSARTKLAGFILTMITRMIGHGPAQWERELMLREVARPSDACQGMVQEFIRPQFALLEGILAELMPGVPAARRRLVAFSVVGQCLHYRVVQPVIQMLVSEEEFATYEPRLLADHITQLTLGGIEHIVASSAK